MSCSSFQLLLVSCALFGATLGQWVSTTEPPMETTLTMETSTDLGTSGNVEGKPCEEICMKTLEEQKETKTMMDDLKKKIEIIQHSVITPVPNPCKIDVTSVSFIDGATDKVLTGQILINGQECVKCNNKKTGLTDQEAGPGLAICTIDPATCTKLDTRHFNLSTSDMHTHNDSKYFTTYMSNLRYQITVVGTSCGDISTGLDNEAKLLLKVLNAPLENLESNEKVAFIVQTKAPSKGLAVLEKSSPTELKVSFNLRGTDTRHYWYEKTGHVTG